MALDRIEKLVTKYFEGETSIAEEKELKNYFSSSDVAQHLEQYKSVFGYFSKEKEQKFSKKLPLKSNARVMWLSIAATTVLSLGIGTYLYLDYKNSTEIVGCNSSDDPEVVLRETQKALDLVSRHINTGVASIGYINEYNNSKNRIFK